MARWSSGLRLRPLTPATAVRIRYGSPHRRRQKCRRRHIQLVLMTVRVHLFPSRTQQLSSLVPTILGWKRPGKIGRRQHKLAFALAKAIYCSLAQSVERMTVNHDVVSSSLTGAANEKATQSGGFFYYMLRLSSSNKGQSKTHSRSFQIRLQSKLL